MFNKSLLGISVPLIVSLTKKFGSANKPDDYFCLKDYDSVLDVPENKILYSDIEDFLDRTFGNIGVKYFVFPFKRRKKNTGRYIAFSSKKNPSVVRDFLKKCNEFKIVFMDNEEGNLRIEEAFRDKKAKDFFISNGYEENMWLPASSFSTKSSQDYREELERYGDYLNEKGLIVNVGVVEPKNIRWKDNSNYLCTVWCSPCGFWRIYRADNENTFLLVRVNEDGSFTYVCREKYTYQNTTRLKILSSLWYCSRVQNV